MKNEKYLDEMHELISEALEDDPSDLSFLDEILKPEYSIYSTQPKNSSWVHFFWSYGGLANEYTSALFYGNAEQFQEELIKQIRAVFTPKTLEYIREAKVTEFGMHISPYQPSGGNIKNDYGIDVPDEMKDRGE